MSSPLVAPHSPGVSPSSPQSRKRSAARASEEASGDNLKVICRVRPFAQREFEIHDDMNSKLPDHERQPLRSVIDMEGQVTKFLDHTHGFQEKEKFTFDVSLWSIPPDQQEGDNPFADQLAVMTAIGEPCVQQVWDGFNTCVFAYGQTGSGKTYTMMGYNEQEGLIPRLCRRLFQSIDERKDQPAIDPTMVVTYRLEASFLEIYNEKVKDLLWSIRSDRGDHGKELDHENLKVRNTPNSGPQVVGLTTISVDNWEDCLAIINEGTLRRSVASTKMNDTSSRSHSIFKLLFTQITTIPPAKQFEKPQVFERLSQLNLVDLAGSERNKKTGAEGARLKEAVAINQSLTTLKNVIDALVENRPIVPFRESQLTWLLSDSLGGNSKTFMVACVSPHSDNADESLNTLRYALRAQGISCNAVVNESSELRKITKLHEEMEKLKTQMADGGPKESDLKKQEFEVMQDKRRAEFQRMFQKRQEEKLHRQLQANKDMRYNSSFHSNFRTVLYKWMHDRWQMQKSRLSVREAKMSKSTATQENTVIELEQQVGMLKAEEEVLADKRGKVEFDREHIQADTEAMESLVKELLTADERDRDMLERRERKLQLATHLSRINVAWASYIMSHKFRVAKAHCERQIENLEANASRDEDDTKRQHSDRVQTLRHDVSEMIEKVERIQETMADTEKQLKARYKQLLQESVYSDHELKNVIEAGSRDVQQLVKDSFARFEAKKEELEKRLRNREVALRRQYEDDIRDLRKRKENEHAMSCKKLERLKTEGSQDVRVASSATTRNLERITSALQEKTTKIDRLNSDTTTFLAEEARSDAPIAKAFAELQRLVANPPKDTQAAKLIKDIKGVAPPPLRSQTPLKWQKQREEPEKETTPVPRTGSPSISRLPTAACTDRLAAPALSTERSLTSQRSVMSPSHGSGVSPYRSGASPRPYDDRYESAHLTRKLRDAIPRKPPVPSRYTTPTKARPQTPRSARHHNGTSPLRTSTAATARATTPQAGLRSVSPHIYTPTLQKAALSKKP